MEKETFLSLLCYFLIWLYIIFFLSDSFRVALFYYCHLFFDDLDYGSAARHMGQKAINFKIPLVNIFQKFFFFFYSLLRWRKMQIKNK